MKTIIRDSGEGEQLWFYGGGLHTWKVRAEETNGEVSIFEDTLERGKTTPLHSHPEHDEILFVIEGEILAHADGDHVESPRVDSSSRRAASRMRSSLSQSARESWRS